MQALTEKTYRLAPPGGLFDDAVVRNLFPDATLGARKALVHRAVQHQEIVKLKPGLYCLAPDYRKSHPHPFVVASALHSPSHISLESALSFHQLIPEAVYRVSSVTVQRTRSFENPFGVFTFYRVPSHQPRAGVRAEKLGSNAWAFVASPLRAIADLIYLRKEISWGRDGRKFLIESMRIEEEDLFGLPVDDFSDVHDSIRNRRTQHFLRGLVKEIRG
jgi:hypothetical protein